MTHYAWTIEAKGRQPIKKVTTLEGIRDVLRLLDLPGFFPSDWSSIDVGISDHGNYTHNQGCDDEWSLRWTRVGFQTLTGRYAGSSSRSGSSA